MAEQNITIKQKNSSGSYDTLYPATTVNQLSGVLPESKGGTGVTSLSAMLTAAGGARIQTGSYVGTGTYGASNPCTLTFDFVPKLMLMSWNGAPPNYNQYNTSLAIWKPNYQYMHRVGTGSVSTDYCTWSLSGTTLSWNNDINSPYKADGQWNDSTSEYYYIAFE